MFMRPYSTTKVKRRTSLPTQQLPIDEHKRNAPSLSCYKRNVIPFQYYLGKRRDLKQKKKIPRGRRLGHLQTYIVILRCAALFGTDTIWRRQLYQWWIQGRAHLLLDQTAARRAEKIFGGRPLHPYLRVWMTAPPSPPPLGLDPALKNHNDFRRCTSLHYSYKIRGILKFSRKLLQ